MKAKRKLFSVSLLSLLLIIGCAAVWGPKVDSNLENKIVKFAKKSVTQKELLEHLEFLTSERLGGRPTGSWHTGGISLETILVTDYLKERCQNWELQPAGEKQSPNQHFFSTNQYGSADSLNIAFCVPGIKLDKEYIVLVAHYDHIGYGSGKSGRSFSPPKYHGKQIHPGAEDNASGVSALLELAQVFSDLCSKGIRPKRSIIFLFVGAEEVGLHGSSYYTTNFPLEGKIVTAISLDMLGRGPASDSFKLVACEPVSETPQRIPEIFSYIQKWKNSFGFYKINYPPDGEGYFSRSDHYPFWENSPKDNRTPSLLLSAGMDEEKLNEYEKELIAVFFGEKPDVDKDKRFYYHTVWDTLRDEEGNLNIDLDRLERFSEFLTILVWEIANGPKPDFVENLN